MCWKPQVSKEIHERAKNKKIVDELYSEKTYFLRKIVKTWNKNPKSPLPLIKAEPFFFRWNLFSLSVTLLFKGLLYEFKFSRSISREIVKQNEEFLFIVSLWINWNTFDFNSSSSFCILILCLHHTRGFWFLLLISLYKLW